MAFMKPEYLQGEWWSVDTSCGNQWVPVEVCGEGCLPDYVEGEIESVARQPGVGVRLSAPGYMDCTDWVVFDTMAQARAFLSSTYEVDPDTGDDIED